MKLLVTGNIGYITTEFIEEAFPECQILLLGETEQKSNRNKSLSVYPDAEDGGRIQRHFQNV